LIIKTANYEALDRKDLGNGLYESSCGGFVTKVHFIDDQTYVPQSGAEEGLTHYVFKPKQLVEELEKCDFNNMSLERLQWHIFATFQKN
jgi:hypothetical protein